MALAMTALVLLAALAPGTTADLAGSFCTAGSILVSFHDLSLHFT
jgi:hypothetical protein